MGRGEGPPDPGYLTDLRGGNLQPDRRMQVRILESEHDVSLLRVRVGGRGRGLREGGIGGGEGL